jgi:phenylalanyl-tRNA synthetase alpha chain
LHEYEIAILNLLKKERASSSVTLEDLEGKLDIKKDSILWALENLAASGALSIEREHSPSARLTREGKEYLTHFPEQKLVGDIHKSGKMQVSHIKDQIALLWAKRNNWIAIDKGEVKLTDLGREIAEGKKKYNYSELLALLNGSEHLSKSFMEKNKEEIANLRKRELTEILEKSKIKSIKLTEQGRAIKTDNNDTGIGQLTRELIISGKWEREKFRKYDINAPTEEPQPARLHPIHEFIDIIRTTWFDMGFKEVSGPIIESSFWNFDALFLPQDHPARDMQDTFFLSNPKNISIEDIALMKKIKGMHTKNWKETWKAEVAKQSVLRTHTTSVSAHSIKEYGSENEKSYPLKFFSIGRVFRNEAIDYKHLAEFYQTDGIIIGNNLNFSNLIYTLKEFYSRLGFNNLIFRPAYFSFVEPGLEIFYHDEKRDEEIELLGGGVIRKEITKALGTNKTVLAWGGGLDRLLLRALGINSILELYKNEVGWLRKRKEIKL